MVRENVRIISPSGLQMQPVADFSALADRFSCTVSVRANGFTVNAKSVLSLLAACVQRGDIMTIECDGPDEEEAMQSLIGLVLSGLGEKQE